MFDSLLNASWRHTLRATIVGVALATMSGCGGGGTDGDDGGEDTTSGGGTPTGGSGSGGSGTGSTPTGGTGTTPTGFALLQDIHPTASSEPEQFIVVNGKAFFLADDGVHGRELWVTDGTVAGTRMVKDIRSGDSSASIARLTEFNGKVAFSASDGVAFEALWVSDGTAAGTQMVKDISPTSENIIFVGTSGTKIYFTATTSASGRELWVSDGTSDGTFMVSESINPGTAGSDVRIGTGWNGKFYFYAYNQTSKNNLYVTDGTMGNLGRLTFGDNHPDTVLLDYDMIAFKDQLYFTWHTYANGRELWVTDGSVGGTRLFADLDTRNSGSAYDGWPSHFDVLGDTLLFFAYAQNSGMGGSGKSLWRTTGGAPELIAHVSHGANMDRMVLMNGRYYFPGYSATVANGLYSTDGTASGTQLLSSAVTPDSWYYSNKVAVIGTKLVFQGRDSATGYEPWVTDGTPAGTSRLGDLYPGTTSSYPQLVMAGWITARNNKAYFVARSAADDFHLFETDGTQAGTAKIAPPGATVTVNPMGQPAFSGMTGLTAPVLVGSTLVFGCRYTSAGEELCKM